VSDAGRVSAFQENPNGLATMLSLGVLALLGLAYGRQIQDWKARILFWGVGGVMGLNILKTGSRGAALALAVTVLLFFLKGKNWAGKLKFGGVALVGILLLAWFSYRIDAVRVRWERTFYEESLAGREYIFPEAIAMILEQPLIGWGPVNHLWELGPRTHREFRDEHNLYLWVLAEVGLVGATPFFVGLWLCWRSAWRGRHTHSGIVPLLMLLFMLVSGMKGTLHNEKFFWVILALGLASGSAAAHEVLVRGRSIPDVALTGISRRAGRPVFSHASSVSVPHP
jgi:O-antigen ligase